jgi:hypothetical protein
MFVRKTFDNPDGFGGQEAEMSKRREEERGRYKPTPLSLLPLSPFQHALMVEPPVAN